MILFVFEGERREPMLFESIERLFFGNCRENILCSFGNNIYELFRRLEELGDGADILGVLKSGGAISSEMEMGDFSEIYLFFDLDLHDGNQSVSESQRRLAKMLEYFSDETDNGKLYVNYPMIESIYHTSRLPDSEYWQYTVKIEECVDYKRIAREIPPYSNLDHLLVHVRNMHRADLVARARANWLHLVAMNVAKAAFICGNPLAFPVDKAIVEQSKVFESQLHRYIEPRAEIAVLNAFPLFIYDYFRPEALHK